MKDSNEITINGVTYVKKSETGPLSLYVLERGFIFVGEVDKADETGVWLTSCQSVRKWGSGGIGGLSRGAKSSVATLDDHEAISFGYDKVIYSARLRSGWHDA